MMTSTLWSKIGEFLKIPLNIISSLIKSSIRLMHENPPKKFGSSMIRGSTAIGKEYFKNVPESKLYFYIACLRDIKMLLYLRSINILLDRGT